MAKLTLASLTSSYRSNAALNANFDAIEAAIENTLSRDGTAPNAMSADFDMGSNRIINVTDPTDNQDGATKAYVDQQIRTVSDIDNLALLDADQSFTGTNTFTNTTAFTGATTFTNTNTFTGTNTSGERSIVKTSTTTMDEITGASESHLVITSDRNVTADTTISSDTTLEFSGGKFVISAGATLTIDSKVLAPPGVQIFDCQTTETTISAMAPETVVNVSSVSSGTVTTDAAHNLAVGEAVRFASLTASSENGDWKVATVPTSTTFTVEDRSGSVNLTDQGSAAGTASRVSKTKVTVADATGMTTSTPIYFEKTRTHIDGEHTPSAVSGNDLTLDIYYDIEFASYFSATAAKAMLYGRVRGDIICDKVLPDWWGAEPTGRGNINNETAYSREINWAIETAGLVKKDDATNNKESYGAPVWLRAGGWVLDAMLRIRNSNLALIGATGAQLLRPFQEDTGASGNEFDDDPEPVIYIAGVDPCDPRPSGADFDNIAENILVDIQRRSNIAGRSGYGSDALPIAGCDGVRVRNSHATIRGGSSNFHRNIALCAAIRGTKIDHARHTAGGGDNIASEADSSGLYIGRAFLAPDGNGATLDSQDGYYYAKSVMVYPEGQFQNTGPAWEAAWHITAVDGVAANPSHPGFGTKAIVRVGNEQSNLPILNVRMPGQFLDDSDTLSESGATVQTDYGLWFEDRGANARGNIADFYISGEINGCELAGLQVDSNVALSKLNADVTITNGEDHGIQILSDDCEQANIRATVDSIARGSTSGAMLVLAGSGGGQIEIVGKADSAYSLPDNAIQINAGGQNWHIKGLVQGYGSATTEKVISSKSSDRSCSWDVQADSSDEVAAASALELPLEHDVVRITGSSTTISSITSSTASGNAWPDGHQVTLVCESAQRFRHNVTNFKTADGWDASIPAGGSVVARYDADNSEWFLSSYLPYSAYDTLSVSSNEISPYAAQHMVDTSSASVTIDTVTDGTVNGQRVSFRISANGNSATFEDNAAGGNMQLQSDRVLGNRNEILELEWVDATNTWIEAYYSDNV